ncbi:uncharacterized protein [Apostichopus japonicus]|uniref:uncharacterized protein n=1 Tax=Stichopus japonicus TaxID=307972 RepID=UPI003AB78316
MYATVDLKVLFILVGVLTTTSLCYGQPCESVMCIIESSRPVNLGKRTSTDAKVVGNDIIFNQELYNYPHGNDVSRAMPILRRLIGCRPEYYSHGSSEIPCSRRKELGWNGREFNWLRN